MFLLLLLQNGPSLTIYYRLLGSHPSKSTIRYVYSLSDTLFIISFPTNASVQFLSSNTHHNCPHIFLHLLPLQAISNSLPPTLLSSTFYHILPLVYHDEIRLFLFSTSYFSYIHLFFPSTLTPLSFAVYLPLILF